MRAVLLFATLLVWIVRVLGAVAPSSATATAPTFLARAFRGPITRLALFHCGECRIRPRRPLRWLLAILWLAFTLFVIAVARMVATGIRVLARSFARLVAFAAIGSAIRAAVPLVAARRIPMPLGIA